MSKNFCKIEGKWCKYCKKSCGCKYNMPIGCYTPQKDIHKCPKREKDETMSFRELLFNVSFNDIMEAMYKYWPEEKRNERGYKKLYTSLLTIHGKKTNFFIECTKESMYLYDDNGKKKDIPDYYIDAYCVRKNNNTTYAMDFTPWNEAVTMNMTKECLSSLSMAEIAAGVFYEITFHGFNECDINDSKEDLYKNFEECKKLAENEKKQ